jgi:Transposase IS66 family
MEPRSASRPVQICGVLERDGWAPYHQFTAAKHQTCHAHLLRRTSELIASSAAGRARVPLAARRILKDTLMLRDQQDVIDAEEFGLRQSTRQTLTHHPMELTRIPKPVARVGMSLSEVTR